ncbi:MAG TPA: serine hydrolase [Trichocoleus sp.]
MAQYGDPSNIIRPPFRRHQPQSDAISPGVQTGPNAASPNAARPNAAGPNAAGSNSLQLPQPPRPASPASAPENRQSIRLPQQPPAANSWVSRRKNQWREHQQLPPQAGMSSPGDPSPLPPPSAPMSRKPLNLPTSSGSSSGPTAKGSARPVSTGFSGSTFQPRTLSQAVPPAAQPPVSPTTRPSRSKPQRVESRMNNRLSNKVTPLRSRQSPNTVGGAWGGGTGGSVDLPGSPPRPRRKAPKTPMPVLYAIRLLILGVGVAAIAGTLLSTLSPSQLSAPAAPTTQEATANRSILRGLRGGRPTVPSVSAITLNDELTRLKTELEQVGTLTPGLTQAAFVLDLDTGRYVDIAGDQPISAASTIKLPILVAFLQAVDAGKVSLEQVMVMQSQHIATGSGEFQVQPPGTRYSALQVATEMIISSDNTATNMIIELLGGAEVLNQQFQTWGLKSTVLRNPLPDLQGTNTTSPRDLALLTALVDRGDLLSVRSRDRMFTIMQRTYNRSLIPSGIEKGAIIGNKTGDIASVLGDVALVDTPTGKRYVLATLIKRPDNDGRAGELIRRISERVHKEMNQAPPLTGEPPVSPATPGGQPASSPNQTGGPSPNQPGVSPTPGSPLTGPGSPQPNAPAAPERVPGRLPQG